MLSIFLEIKDIKNLIIKTNACKVIKILVIISLFVSRCIRDNYMARRVGIEPTTYRLEVCCSIRLSYRRMIKLQGTYIRIELYFFCLFINKQFNLNNLLFISNNANKTIRPIDSFNYISRNFLNCFNKVE